ncbi:dTDP-4-dehydrorhamnose 3,5-epimerase [Phyllobacterium sp. BT25]|uniref:dTDP-4-dehydrorhamnose 3,5-epimerase n=1 Tax=Phyllobacterium pellucidum TaxID=2740464 RepID=A0A849VS53_9HYPH|nr:MULTISPECIES: dTDP-4-dehydrorhamnose 3,5-epimerase [Phyllobacterium]NTS30897.1 dTDP-4-dehydrorhamnose 3,5-epimerase [Phyllobacterium pellucidum]
MLDIRPLGLDGVLEIAPKRFGDDRGFFSETYNAALFKDAGIDLVFVQDNHSLSVAKGVLRGLHYQLPPKAQDKLVRVVRGSIIDVAVDIRKGSPTFGKWVALELSAAKWNQILVPKGFAHGFMTLEENTEVVYKVTDYYSPAHDRSIRFDDPEIGIDWPIATDLIQLSDKDRAAPRLADAETFIY